MKKRSQLNESMSFCDLLQSLRTLLQNSSLKSFSFRCSALCHTLGLQTLLFILYEVLSKSRDLVNVDTKRKPVEEEDSTKHKENRAIR